jgi:hypothetical protein
MPASKSMCFGRLRAAFFFHNKEYLMTQLIPKTHMLHSMVNHDLPNGPVSALSEFIDNSVGEGSGNAERVEIHYKRDAVVIIDNGVGVSDINALFTIGDSHNRLHAKDIGNFGYGSKVGALFIGWEVEAHTVYEGKYHLMSVDWSEVEKSGKWPNQYRGKGVSPRNAPKAIRNGGTIITIKQRHKSRTWQSRALAERLAHIYSPAIRSGAEIVLFHWTPNGKKCTSIKLADHLERFEIDRVIEFSGDIDGKTYTGRAGVLPKTAKRAMNGTHIAFGHRVIRTEYGLPNMMIPSRFYAEVQLGSEWKRSLTATKADIAHDKSDLMNAIVMHCGELLEYLEPEAQALRLDIIQAHFADAMAEALKTAILDEEGDSGVGELVDAMNMDLEGTEAEGMGDDGEPPTVTDLEAYRAEGKGKNATRTRKPKNNGIEFRFANLGEGCAFRTTRTDNRVMIELNKDIDYIHESIQHPLNTSAVWGLASTAMVELIFEDLKANAGLVPEFGKRVSDTGACDQKELRDSLYFTLLDNTPDVPDVSKTEIEEAM